jgi:hypothetical protein
VAEKANPKEKHPMTKLVSRIATGIAILGLAAPAFAATTSNSASATAPAAQTSAIHHAKAHTHKRVASAEEKKASPKKSEKKVEKKGTVKGAKTEAPAAPSAAPSPASK